MTFILLGFKVDFGLGWRRISRFHQTRPKRFSKPVRSLLITVLLSSQSFILLSQPKTLTKSLSLMGSRFEITTVDEDESLCQQGIDSAIHEIQRIERLISSWDPSSQCSEVNRQAGIRPVKVDLELFQLIRRARKVSALTQGAFDISYASIDKIWKFDGSMKSIPTPKMIQASIAKVGYTKVILKREDTTVFLTEKGMKIGFGGIGKGYAANKARNLLQQLGINNGLVNAGGDLIAWGKQANGKSWQIGIASPTEEKIVLGWLDIQNQAVVTSGDYERFAMIDGKRYGHIINPATGYPATGIKSVSVVCPDAELADALATAVFVMGTKKGLALINQLKHIECLIVTDENKIASSIGMELKKQ